MKSNEANSNQAMSDEDFWVKASEPSFDAIWSNAEDDVYAELERRDAEGYLKHPQQPEEIEEWQNEQAWVSDEFDSI
ncbi:MAG: hypothetical protein DMF76_11100 [Acidobacteria bacterium]|nr:MAG: hypothetical protein DMF76_11100 [Acidobacteriota bacterium]